MRSPLRPLFILAGIVIVAAAGCGGLDTKKKKPPARGFKPPPAREVREGGVKLEADRARECPPNRERRIKALLKPKIDRDVDGDKRDDYFMGSFVFVDKAGNDLIVTLWCISIKPTNLDGKPVFNDFFSFQIATSKPGEGEVTKVPPAAPI